MSHFSRLQVCALAAVLLAAGPAQAQEFTWTQTNSFQLGNVPGLVARMLGSGRETIETSHLAGHRLRTESGSSATVIDVDAGHITTLDTKAKTYTRMTFEEMAEALRAATMDGEATAGGRAATADGEPQYDVRFDASVDVTGERRTIAGYDAARSLIRVTVTSVPRDERQRRDAEAAGSLTFLIDSWTSSAVPHDAALRAFQQAYAEKLGLETDRAQPLQALFAQHPGMQEGWAAAMKELQKVEGVPLRTTTYIVSVPAGMTFDRQLALEPPAREQESTGSRVSRGIGGRLRAAAGQQQQPADDARPASQSTIVTVASELREIRPGGVPANAWEIPAGFREVRPKK